MIKYKYLLAQYIAILTSNDMPCLYISIHFYLFFLNNLLHINFILCSQQPLNGTIKVKNLLTTEQHADRNVRSKLLSMQLKIIMP